MTDREENARKIIDTAFALRVSIYCVRKILNTIWKIDTPKLTFEECKAISKNYPVSYEDIREEFKEFI